jgi:ABC-type sugar transport system permease subunit
MTPWLLGFFGFTLIPMLISLYYSFTISDLLTTGKLGRASATSSR